MIAVRPDFDHTLDEANQALQERRLPQALELFELAESAGINDTDRARATKGQGIVLRLLVNFDEAESTFNVALGYDDIDDELRGTILRDYAEVFHDRGNRNLLYNGGWNDYVEYCFNKANELFDKSYALLEDVKPLEAAATLGFQGMLHIDEGKRKLGISELRQAQLMLFAQHPVYEANNLVRLMRASISDRWRYCQYAFVLTSKRSPSWARRKEVWAILLGGNAGYEWAKNHMR